MKRLTLLVLTAAVLSGCGTGRPLTAGEAAYLRSIDFGQNFQAPRIYQSVPPIMTDSQFDRNFSFGRP